MERLRMFRAFDPNDQQLPVLEQQADELRQSLQNNASFSQLPSAQRTTLLRGERSGTLTQDEILQRMGKFDPKTRGYYRFLSSHTHSFPLSFYRMAEQNRGRGEENDIEKGYIGSTLEFCAEVLETSTDEFQNSFADIASFTRGTFNWDVLRESPSAAPARDGTKVES
jgi:hypothetical protein